MMSALCPAEALDRRIMGELEDKETQTEPASQPATPRRPMPAARNAVRQPPRPTPRQPPPPRPQQPIVKREPRPVSQPKPPPNVHVATAAGDEVAESLPAARAALPSAHPTLPPKRQWQKSMREIHVPTTLLKRRGPAAEHTPRTEVMAINTPEAEAAAPAVTATEADALSTPEEAAAALAAVASPNAAIATSAAAPDHGSARRDATSAARASPPLAIMAGGKHATPNVPNASGPTKPPPGPHPLPSGSLAAAESPADRNNAAANAAGLSMLDHANNQPSKPVGSQPKPKPASAPAPVQPAAEQQQVQQAVDIDLAHAGDIRVAPSGADSAVARQPDREVLTIGEGGELRPVSALTEGSLGTEPSQAPSRLETPSTSVRATGEVPYALPAVLASFEVLAVPEASQQEPSDALEQAMRVPLSARSADDTSTSRPASADGAQAVQQPQHSAQTDADYAVQVHHAPAGRLHRNRAHTRPQSPLQGQISSVHGSSPAVQQPGDESPAAGPVKIAQRAQHAVQNRQQSKVPPLNMAVMRALKQQVTGLVPLSGGASSKAARTVLQQTAPASQRALSTKALPAVDKSTKADAQTQLTPLSSNALRSRSLPRVSPLPTARSPTVQNTPPVPNTTRLQPLAASHTQLTLPGKLAATARQTLSSDATLQLIGDMYDSKGVADLAALRQKVPCRPMQQFVQQYLERRFGAGAGGSWLAAWQQLEAGVKVHAADDARVAAFATSCGMLQAAAAPSSAQVGYTLQYALVGTTAKCPCRRKFHIGHTHFVTGRDAFDVM